MRCRFGVLSLCVLLTLGAGSAAARSSHATTRPVRLSLGFHLVSSDALAVASDRRYVAFLEPVNSTGTRLTVIDEQRRVRVTLRPPACPSDPLGVMAGGPWLMVLCSYGTFDLYDFARGGWKPLRLGGSCVGGTAGCQPLAVGRFWIKLSLVSDFCGDHCSVSYVLENIATGRIKPDPVTPGGRVVDALDSRGGSRALCSPLRFPRSYNAAVEETEPGQLLMVGRFALASGDFYSPSTGAGTGYRLERCGSRRSLSLTTSGRAALSSHAVVWTADQKPGSLLGRFLPGTRPFAVVLPTDLQQPALVGLTDRTIYLEAGDARHLWAATLKPPPSRHG